MYNIIIKQLSLVYIDACLDIAKDTLNFADSYEEFIDFDNTILGLYAIL